MFDFKTSVVLAVALGLFVALRKLNSGKRRAFPYPPGPKSNIILGNLMDMPLRKEWLTYERWGKECGSDIVHAQALGNHIVVLNSAEAVEGLLEKNASLTSGRPEMPMIDLTGLEFNSSLYQPNDLWRKHRTHIQQNFSKTREVTYQPLQIRKVQQLLQNLTQTPEDFELHARTLSLAIIMAITYGHDVEPVNDRFVKVADVAFEMAGDILSPGALLVNTIPALRRLPRWFPGTTFYKRGAEVKKLMDKAIGGPFDFIKDQLAEGVGQPSIIGNMLEELEVEGGIGRKSEEKFIKDLGASIYAAGADTTVAASKTFFHAMALHPHVQRKIQAELDRVVGRDRLPEFADRPNLPYIEATFRELMRWRPITPMGIPHSATEDIVYEGYFISKGAVIIGNVWAMTRAGWDDPEVFRPERHLDENGQLIAQDNVITFGFGRRVCPGRHLAGSTVFIMIASVLAAFDISLVRDEGGKVVELDPNAYTVGILSHPESFKCSITPRSQEAVQLIKEGWIEKD